MSFGEILWAMVVFFLFVIWIYLLITIFVDIFRSRDLNGWGKAAWTLFIIILPLLGVLVYVIARGDSMQERHAREVEAAQKAQDDYVREVAGSDTTADQLSKLNDLRNDGALTEEEYQAEKQKLLS